MLTRERERELTYGDDKFIIQKNAAFLDNKGVPRQQRVAENKNSRFRIVGPQQVDVRLLNYHVVYLRRLFTEKNYAGIIHRNGSIGE